MKYRFFVLFMVVSHLAGCNFPIIPQSQSAHSPEASHPRASSQSGSFKPFESFRSFFTHADLEDDKWCQVDPASLAAFRPTDHLGLWDRIRGGYKLNVPLNDRVQVHVDWYTRNQSYIDRVIERGSRYLYYIVNQLEEHQMPLELAFLPIVESAFDPFAYSHGRASGMWQFIPETGRRFGLRQNWWYDGRRDIEASTDAAIQYLSYLNKRFDGDWLLALAAYNSGEGNVDKAIYHNQRHGVPTDFWSLKLPQETRAYVPQLLALADIFRRPEEYAITLAEIPNEPYFTRVNVNSQIDLAQAADLADIDIETLYLLNAGFNRWATDPQGSHHLLLPVNKADTFSARLKKVPQKDRIGWERYVVKSGDTLDIIGRHFNTSVKSLKKINKLRGSNIQVGQTLMIPVAIQPAKHYAYSADQRLRRKQKRSRGEEGSTRVHYKVKAGDNLWKVAQIYGVDVEDIARWNGMAPRDPLRADQNLVVWTKNPIGTTVDISDQYADNPIIRKVAYQVREGDSLARIADKFNLSVKDIKRWNTHHTDNFLQPGQSLTLFVDVTRVN